MKEGGPRLERDRPSPAATTASTGPDPSTLVRVRTLVAGICNTDLEIAKGYMGFHGVLGHEFVGEATEGAWKGRRVVGGINFGCGRCDWCVRGLSRHCPTRTVLGILGADGVLAEEFLIPEANLLAVPDGVRDEDAAFAEPVGAACEILEQLGPFLDLSGKEAALVLGAGKLGAVTAQVLAASGLKVDLVGRHLAPLGWMRERGIRLVEDRPDRDGYALVVEATGTTEGLRTAIACTRPRGHRGLEHEVMGTSGGHQRVVGAQGRHLDRRGLIGGGPEP